jgi:hypothetical protein
MAEKQTVNLLTIHTMTLPLIVSATVRSKYVYGITKCMPSLLMYTKKWTREN